MQRSPYIHFLAAVVGVLVSLATTSATASGGRRPQPSEGVCVGVRGNGPRLWAHFSSLARISEELGEISGAAGGSSGSITVFLAESVRANPLVSQCGQRSCSRRERTARQALLFKSIEGLQQAGLIEDVLTLVALANAVQQAGIEALLADPSTAAEGVAALTGLLSDAALRAIINPELLLLLQQSPDPVFHARDVIDGLATALSFQVDDARPFLRPGVINFASFAEIVGRLGTFLAGVGPVDLAGQRAFLRACATPGRGLEWPQVAALPVGNTTCGALFSTLFDGFRDALTEDSPSRLNDPIGRFLPALVTTSVLQGDAVSAFQTAKARYFAADPPDSLGVAFEDVGFGYWGRHRDLTRVQRRLRKSFRDAKSAKFTRIGEATWREILQFSPAEPGLARALELPDGRVSSGGWTDPVPSQVLHALGCRRVVLVNRQDGIGGFTTDVASELGASPADLADLYNLSDRRSGFTTALRAADGVWCTDWDAPDAFDIRALSAQGWSPPLETKVRRFLRYPKASRNISIPGCTPGITP